MNDFCNHSFLLFCYHSSLVYDRTVEIIFTANRSSGRQCIFPHPSDLDFLSHFFQLNLQEASFETQKVSEMISKDAYENVDQFVKDARRVYFEIPKVIYDGCVGCKQFNKLYLVRHW